MEIVLIGFVIISVLVCLSVVWLLTRNHPAPFKIDKEYWQRIRKA